MQSKQIQTVIEDIRQQFVNQTNCTELGEPQAWVPLNNGRYLEVTHEEYGLQEKDQFYSWRIHCSDEEFDEDLFHSTMGIIDLSNSDDLKPETLERMVSWALRVVKDVAV